ncbi:MAG: hypothetical protein HY236_14655 [Acidobacteria bacterium]|nr:hypothetical protein [Acidobacteriota bacterium]
MLRSILLAACFFVSSALAQYTVEPNGLCDAEGVSAGMKAALEAGGYRVKDGSGAPFVEVWLRKAVPTEKPADPPRGSDFPDLPMNTLVGVIRYVKAGADYRGQPIKPGVYTLRFSLHPEDGNHQGVAPRRDFFLLSPVTIDPDPAAKLTFDAVVGMSRKASGTTHPSTLFLLLPDSGTKYPSVQHTGDNHEVVNLKTGSLELGITVVGKSEG